MPKSARLSTKAVEGNQSSLEKEGKNITQWPFLQVKYYLLSLPNVGKECVVVYTFIYFTRGHENFVFPDETKTKLIKINKLMNIFYTKEPSILRERA